MRKIVKTIAMVATVAILATLVVAAANSQALPKPTDVTASNTAEGHVLVSWDDDAAPVHRVGWTHDAEFMAAQAAGDWLEAFHFADTKRDTDYTIKYLPGGQPYWIIVGATNERFSGATWSDWTSLTTAASATSNPAPAAPVQDAVADCSDDDYERDEWGEYPAPDPQATPAWTKPDDDVAARDITLDHHVALQDAHISGGCDWSETIKNDFATDQDNLNPTTRSFNSSKGSRTPDQLTGIAQRIIDTDGEKCDYATQHDEVKDKYDLAMTASEQATVEEWLALCPMAMNGDASTDRAALVALYNATDGPNWDDHQNWLTDHEIEEWSGVFTDGTGRVTHLYLRGNGLDGSIPAEMGDLARLTKYLDLSYNDLSGPIPSELGNLTNLEELRLHHNELSGSIPNELDDLSNLTELLLTRNNLTGTIPTGLGSLSNLTKLELRSNELSGTIPTQLGNLTNLTHLDLWNNELSGAIPTQLANLTNLTDLELGNNNLTGTIPTQLGNLSNLTILDLAGNNLIGTIPAELGNLTNLEMLFLAVNNLSGEIPPQLGNLTNLTWLSLSSNNLTGCVPADLHNIEHNDMDQVRLPVCG